MPKIIIDCFYAGKKVAEFDATGLTYRELERFLDCQRFQGRTWKKRIVKKGEK